MTRLIRTAHDGDSGTASDETTLVVGGGRLGWGVATALSDHARSVAFVDEDAIEATDAGVDVISRRVQDAGSFRDVLASVGDVGAVVAVGPDSEALLVAHLARLELEEASVFALVDDPERQRAFDGLEVESISTSTLLAAAIRERVRQSALV
jgi:Trk K+ transport system NAD-binding subunit